MRHTEDQGTAFGSWPNNTARLMYHDIMPLALNGIDTSGRVADLGGANGLLKQWIPQAITVDYDASKNPDVCEDIRSHVGDYDLVVLRYVLHYMGDIGVRGLMRHLAATHKGRVLVVQFVNDDLAAKRANSVGETKWFRTTEETHRLLCETHRVLSAKAVDYVVEAEFYRDRLNHPNPTSHHETVLILEMEALQ